MRRPFRIRRRLGHSLVEMSIASTILVATFGLAFPAMKSIGDAGDEGRASSWTQADNRQALLRISRDVMNGSVTATDAMGDLRFSIATGDDRQSLTGDLGFTSTVESRETVSTGSAFGSFGSSTNYYTSSGGASATGSGARGGTKIGRDRVATGDAQEYDAGAFRPRERFFAANSVLRFQKIRDYTWGSDGEPVINWGNWVEYRVNGRELVRIENGRSQVISPNTSGFFVERTNANTLQITLVSETRVRGERRFARQANHIEVLPKN